MRLIDKIIDHANHQSNAIAASDEHGNVTWQSLVDRVARAANGFRALGLKPGDRAGILALNSVRYFEAQLALWWAGIIIVPMNIRWSCDEILYAVRDCTMSVLLTDEAFDMLARQVVAIEEGLLLVGLGNGMISSPNFEVLAISSELADLHPETPGELAGIYYTGGTTGFPKGVMLTHEALQAAGEIFLEAVQATPDSRVLHAAPMFHLAAGAVAHAALIAGAANIYVPRFEASRVLDVIEAKSITEMILVPTMIQMMLDDPNYAPDRLRSFRSLLYGASPISEALLTRVRSDLPTLKLVHVYGQTEMGPPVSFLDPCFQVPGGPKSLSVGKPFPSLEVFITGRNGHEAAPYEPGELLARGPTMMQGYWNKKDETENTIVDGWIHTGDIAYYDEDQFIFICDRSKDMVITGGENVFSVEVENAIASHPSVSQVAVIGVPDKKYGERVHAVLVLHEGKLLTLETLIAHCRERIANYKCPRSLELKNEIPISSTGKVLKRLLRDPHWIGLERHVN